jgi:hypothetical protein
MKEKLQQPNKNEYRKLYIPNQIELEYNKLILLSQLFRSEIM